MDSVNSVTPISFNARLVSRVHVNLEQAKLKYKIFELDDCDEEFTEELRKSVDLKKLMPSVKDNYLLNIWNSIFGGAITQNNEIMGRGTKNYLLVNEKNKPCGAMAIFKYLNGTYDKYKLQYICTWPTSKEHREPLAGKALILNMFKKIHEKNDETPGRIELEAVNNSLFSPVAKYLQRGFSIFGGDNYTTNMRISTDKLPEILKKFAKILHIENVEDSKKLNLGESLDLSF